MPKISTFMYCEEAMGNGDKLQINGPLHIIMPAFVPGMFSFSIVCGILGMDITEKSHSLHVRFLSPDKGEEPLINAGPINLGPQQSDTPTDLPMEMRGTMINMDFRNLVFRKDGLYTTEIYLDNELLGEYPIQVKGREK